MEIRPINEKAVVISFGPAVTPAVHGMVVHTAASLRAAEFPGIESVLPSFTAVLVQFNPMVVWDAFPEQGPPTQVVSAFLQQFLQTIPATPVASGRLWDIPVWYDGPDLETAAAQLRMTPTELVGLHSATVYHVFMIGFQPGFAYMGPLPDRLILPRKDTPRLRVPAGSVGIAGMQTGIYPQESPGGWHLIGRTDFILFDPHAHPPARLASGDRVRFLPY